MTAIRAVLIMALLVVVSIAGAAAQNVVEQLVQPDLLSEAHKHLEATCSSCHKAFQKAAQSTLCADCHKPVKSDIAAGSGFHGKHPLVRKSECFNCHTEHEGRDHKLAPVTEMSFDHALTDYPLDGRHVAVPCVNCHTAGKKYAEAPRSCVGCHEADQPHRGALGKECQTCHSTADWTRVAPFDHSKTAFALAGAHAETRCYACHVGEVYKGLPKDCASCHAVQDVHGGRFGAACAQCHTAENWRHTAFDHGKFTRFGLAGAHARITCHSCHGEKLTSKPPLACVDCHAAQDVHRGQLGTACSACHGAAAWRQGVIFDHALTRFPLAGAHAAVACEACHETPAFRDANTACIACHKTDDVHEGRFATRCESCHSAAAWKPAWFDHARDTDFALTGTHAKVGCNGCHVRTNVASAALATDCWSCHKADDVHRGAFGRDCAACHDTTTFKRAVIRK